MHFWIARFIFIFSASRGWKNCGIHNSSYFTDDSFFLKFSVDDFEYFFIEFVFVTMLSKSTKSSCIRYIIFSDIDIAE